MPKSQSQQMGVISKRTHTQSEIMRSKLITSLQFSFQQHLFTDEISTYSQIWCETPNPQVQKHVPVFKSCETSIQ